MKLIFKHGSHDQKTHGRRGGSSGGYTSGEILGTPTITDHGDGTYDVEMMVGGEGHEEDDIRDFVTDALGQAGKLGDESFGAIVDIFTTFEVDGTTSITAGAEEV